MTNYQFNWESITPIDHLQLKRLEANYLYVHIITMASVYLILMALALFLLFADNLWWCVTAECLIISAFVVNISVASKAYRYKGYALREHDITYRSGIFFLSTTTVPFSRIQQVSVKQNPISRVFNLYTVEIVNGAQALPSLDIPGLNEDTARNLKELVTEKLRSCHE